MSLALASGLPVLLDMLTYRRPAWSKTEEAFIDAFIAPLGVQQDDFGNLWKQVGDSPHILWSSHTDTVHRKPGRQIVTVTDGIAALADPKGGGSNCLGADCTSGVWIMREMILAGVPGLYLFHRDEECGGNGSRWIADHYADTLRAIRFAIAFDRKGQSSVITHQGSRTASDAFARSVAAILGGSFAPDDTGIFTDTACYSHLIAECSNLSVGYEMAHGPKETQDTAFLVALRDKVIAADWGALVEARKPGEADADLWATGWADPDDRLSAWEDGGRPYGSGGFDGLMSFIRMNPAIVADYLEMTGTTLEDLESYGVHVYRH